MEELEALKEAEETALKQAEIAAEEAARGLLGDIDLLDEVSLHTNDENHIETPSTRSLSRDEKSSPEDSSKTDSAGSFQNPTQPLSAAIKPNNVHGAGMTESAIQRHVRKNLYFLKVLHKVLKLEGDLKMECHICTYDVCSQSIKNND